MTVTEAGSCLDVRGEGGGVDGGGGFGAWRTGGSGEGMDFFIIIFNHRYEGRLRRIYMKTCLSSFLCAMSHVAGGTISGRIGSRWFSLSEEGAILRGHATP